MLILFWNSFSCERERERKGYIKRDMYISNDMQNINRSQKKYTNVCKN